MNTNPHVVGQCFTGDHLIAESDISQGIDEYKYAVVLLGIATRWAEATPLAGKTADLAYQALYDIVGRHTVDAFYSDCSQ